MVVLDAHIHLHGCFDLRRFLDAARANVDRITREEYGGTPSVGVLCLTEGPTEHGFERLLARADSAGTSGVGASLGNWRVERTGEDESLRVSGGAGREIIVVSGRQIATEERLEVLALGTRTSFEDGKPIEETLGRVAEAGALPVVPWGFGKWTGKRGALVENLLDDDDLPRFFLGDNANRPVFLSRSSLFDRAEARGILNLPGSDPLPFPYMYDHVARAGCVLEQPVDRTAPWRDLRELLTARGGPLQTFLRRESPLRFVRNQLAMQYRKLRQS